MKNGAIIDLWGNRQALSTGPKENARNYFTSSTARRVLLSELFIGSWSTGGSLGLSATCIDTDLLNLAALIIDSTYVDSMRVCLTENQALSTGPKENARNYFTSSTARRVLLSEPHGRRVGLLACQQLASIPIF
jgi:hypothetical protein